MGIPPPGVKWVAQEIAAAFSPRQVVGVKVFRYDRYDPL
jgi:hypothetical protein